MADNDTSEVIPENKEPQTNNVLLFRTAVTNCFKNIAECVSQDEFINTMTVLQAQPALAKKLRKVLVKELYEGMCAELDDMLTDGDLAAGLDKTANLAREAANHPEKNLWRPPGDVKEHLRSLEAQAILEESNTLRKQVEELQAENAAMVKEITRRRAKVQAVHERMNRASKILPSVIPKLEKTVEQLQELVKSIEPTSLDHTSQNSLENT
ncbi:uncharacterized protein [Venturia canescens]|uniref:uncharacterized protein n=1 Tax=Venturia canescens TaxID=32260 RepID=UPI001C9C4BF2|nr:uncharacterized protein LOC122418529 [Venturia canescens]